MQPIRSLLLYKAHCGSHPEHFSPCPKKEGGKRRAWGQSHERQDSGTRELSLLTSTFFPTLILAPLKYFCGWAWPGDRPTRLSSTQSTLKLEWDWRNIFMTVLLMYNSHITQSIHSVCSIQWLIVTKLCNHSYISSLQKETSYSPAVTPPQNKTKQKKTPASRRHPCAFYLNGFVYSGKFYKWNHAEGSFCVWPL